MSAISDTIVKYPFLKRSKETLADVPPAEIVNDEQVLTRAKQRIITGIQSGSIMTGAVENETELKSYPLARILVSIIDEPFVTKKYARAEANTAVNNLKQDIQTEDELGEYLSAEGLKFEDIKTEFNITFDEFSDIESLVKSSAFSEVWEDLTDEEKLSVLEGFGATSSKEDANITRETLYQNLAAKIPPFKQDSSNDKYYTISIADFLRNAVEKDGKRWNLSNRILFEGNVLITKSELFELLEQLFYNEIYEKLPLSINKQLADELQSDVQDIQAALPDDLFFDDINTVEEGAFPPVISTILQRVQDGNPVSHEERITLATFLIHIGMSNDEIIDMLQVHPNFDDQTRYQLQHLRTKGEGGKAYTPPTYSTLKAWGVEWQADELEKKVKHPLTYYRIKLEEKGKLDDQKEGEEKDESES